MNATSLWRSPRPAWLPGFPASSHYTCSPTINNDFTLGGVFLTPKIRPPRFHRRQNASQCRGSCHCSSSATTSISSSCSGSTAESAKALDQPSLECPLASVWLCVLTTLQGSWSFSRRIAPRRNGPCCRLVSAVSPYVRISRFPSDRPGLLISSEWLGGPASGSYPRIPSRYRFHRHA